MLARCKDKSARHAAVGIAACLPSRSMSKSKRGEAKAVGKWLRVPCLCILRKDPNFSEICMLAKSGFVHTHHTKHRKVPCHSKNTCPGSESQLLTVARPQDQQQELHKVQDDACNREPEHVVILQRIQGAIQHPKNALRANTRKYAVARGWLSVYEKQKKPAPIDLQLKSCCMSMSIPTAPPPSPVQATKLITSTMHLHLSCVLLEQFDVHAQCEQ